MKWTLEQKQVIDTRGRDLLVSAAAGSGKTAVLVERIISRITDEKEPLSLDRLLVMTFTRAAAEEMRERIGRVLDERIKQDPENARLRLQKAILPRARIATIDSICQNLIRQHYEALDIDPGFRTPDEGELKLLCGDLLQTLLDEEYEKEDPDFLHFADAYGASRTDAGLTDLIARTAQLIDANPWPKRYLHAQDAELQREANGQFETSLWYRRMCAEILSDTEDYIEVLNQARELCLLEAGPLPYLEMVDSLLIAFRKLAGISHYEERYAFLHSFSLPRLTAVRAAKYDSALKARVKVAIDSARTFLSKLTESYALLPADVLQESIRLSARDLRELLRLTAAYLQRFEAAKRDKNMVDFSDMEHLAIRLLYQEVNGEMMPSPLADDLSSGFDEILVDEYQDSNGLQEALLSALCGARFGRHNLFMVGDVKQSIYRFRLAQPEIFMGKYHLFGTTSDATCKIELNRNFRSRPAVLQSVNDVFRSVMRESLGGVEYDARAALYAGAEFPENKAGKTELIIILMNCKKWKGIEAIEHKDAALLSDAKPAEPAQDEANLHTSIKAAQQEAEYEARCIADKIHELIVPEMPSKSMQVLDKETGGLRPARYSDIAILMRAPGKRAEKMVDILGTAGIPAVSERATGYFNAPEVETMLAFLNSIDNPHQDIALAACLKSPVGAFSDQDLSELRTCFREACEGKDTAPALCGLYEALKYGAETKAAAFPKALSAKCKNFLSLLNHYRSLSDCLPVHTLLYRIYQETGYYHYVSALPLGNIRAKNLDMLLEKAETYAAASYHGLFHFVRYIEMLKSYDTDYSEAQAAAGEEDVVRILSIHKSKGLEYPIVILANAGKQFNREDMKERIVIDMELGLAADYIDTENHVRYPSLKKNVIARQMLEESWGEELRILYVAMTRAKEKLFIVASTQSAFDKIDKFRVYAENAEQGKLPKSLLLQGNSYLDFLLMSGAIEQGSIQLKQVLPIEIEDAETKEALDERDAYRLLLQKGQESGYDSAYAAQLRELLFAKYAHEAETKLKPKVTVSEIKHAAMQLREEAEDASYDDGAFSESQRMQALAEEDAASAMPADVQIKRKNQDASANEKKRNETPQTAAFDKEGQDADTMPKTSGALTPLQDKEGAIWHFAVQASDENDGARAGTAFHRVMELLDFAAWQGGGNEAAQQFAKAELVRMQNTGRLPEAEAVLIKEQDVAAFLLTPLADEMARAARRGALSREQHFMAGFPARELSAETDSAQLQLLQGIIDAWLLQEDGSILLIDYKTDHVRTAEKLKSRYQVQLDLYARALEQLTLHPVKARLIYSTVLRKTIELEQEV